MTIPVVTSADDEQAGLETVAMSAICAQTCAESLPTDHDRADGDLRFDYAQTRCETRRQRKEPMLTRRDVALVSVVAVVLVSLAACGSDTKPATDGEGPDAGGGSGCITFAGANENVFNWKDVPQGVYVGDSPMGDHAKMYAIRIGDAVWLTAVPPDGSDGGVTLPVNDAAKSYDQKLGADVDVASSIWADLAESAEGASATCA